MKYFGELVATNKDYELTIVEDPSMLGSWLVVNSIYGKSIPDIGRDTIQSCKKLALEMYDVQMDTWHLKGKYFESLIAKNNEGYTFRIVEEVPGAGFYLYVFDSNKVNIRDDLQDTLQDCKEIALEMYGVPMDAWRKEGE